jgi:hypothetical protein
MNTGKGLFISLVKEVVSGRKWVFPREFSDKSVDYDEFKKLVSYHELCPFFYPLIENSAGSFPPEIIDILKSTHFYSLMRNQRLLCEFSRVSSVFQQAGIRIVPLKGVAFLQDIYASFPLRPMADIDVLVEEANLRAAGEILLNLGFAERLDGLSRDYWLEKQCHLQFIKRDSDKFPINLDLHFSLDFKRRNRQALPQLWDRVKDGMLSPEDSLFCLALHQRRFGSPLCLKNVIDAGLILKKYQDSLDWGYLFNEAKSGRMGSSMFFLLMQVKTVFGGELRLPALKQFCPSFIKRRLAVSFIRRNIFSDSIGSRVKQMYLKAHFLLYDDFLEPAFYILNIPLEQFAKFYNLDPNSAGTRSLYKRRFLYIFHRLILDFFKEYDYVQKYN